MDHKEYLALSKARELEAKEIALSAFDGQLPAGFVLSDKPDQMYGNATFRIKPERVMAGSKSLHFFHRLMHRTDRVDSTLSTTPTTESVHISCDVFNGRTWEKDVEWGVDGRVESTLLSKADLGFAVRNVTSMALTQTPFVNFEWKRDEYDSHKHHLFNGDEKMGSVWKTGNMWGTTHGIPCETLGNAKVRIEGAAMGMIKTRHDERLSRLTTNESAVWLDSDAEIRTMGVARVSDVGNENVYLEKDGKSFYFKPVNNSRFVVGEHDFSNEVVFGDAEPYERNNMDAAIEYSRETRRLFSSGDLDMAFSHYMRDPLGGGNVDFANTTKDEFVFSMQCMSGGPMASMHLTRNERQAWCESGASDDDIEHIAMAGGYSAIRGNGPKLLQFQDILDHVMESRIISVRNELRELGWDGERGRSLERALGDVTLRANLVCSYTGAGKNVVNFQFDVVDVSQAVYSTVVVDNDMNKSAKVLAEGVNGVLLSLGVESGTSLPAMLNDRYAETIIGNRIDCYDALEIQGVRDSHEPGDQNGTCCEVDNKNPQFFSVYAHLKSVSDIGGVECVGDFGMYLMAEQYAKELSLKYNWPVHDFVKPQFKENADVVKEGAYSGLVTEVTGGVVTQKINRAGDIVKHEAARLNKEVKAGDVLDIAYRDGMGAVRGKDKAVEVGR